MIIRMLSKSIREFKKPSILTIALVFFEVILECLIPFVVSMLLKVIEKDLGIDNIIKYGVLLILMSGLSLTFGALAGKCCAKASCGFARNLRKDMFTKVQTYSFENIDKYQVSSLVTRLTTDISNVQHSYMMLIRTAIRSPFMLIFSFIMGFIMGGKVAFVYVFVIPVLLGGLVLIARKAMPLFRRVFRKYDD